MKKFLSAFLFVLKRHFHQTNPVHKCKFKCTGWCSHFNQVSEIQKGVDNPSWYHYPNAETMKRWLMAGFEYARIMQSHWECGCGKHHTFFFLAKPSFGQGKEAIRSDTIPQTVYNEMITFHPIQLGSNPGSSLSEVRDKQLIADIC